LKDYPVSKPQGAIVEFYMEAVEFKAESEREGRPIFREIPFVRIQNPGDRNNVLEVKANEHYKQRYPRQWDAFQRGQGGEMVGTPLNQWPQITKSQAKEAEYFSIRTVEQLAEVTDTAIKKIGMGWMELRKKARDDLQAAAGTAPITALQAENERLRQEFEALKASIQNPDVPKRGRPRKEEETESA
jgi:hypothetical protein